MVKKNSLKAWFLAARPKTLTGAIAPVLIGGAIAWSDTVGIILQHSRELYRVGEDSSFYLGSHYLTFAIPFVLCVIFAMLMQIDANFVNDWWDFRKGSDRSDRLGPERACAQGWISERAMIIGIIVTTILACSVGFLLLLWKMQWELLIVGIACLLGCFLYTFKFSYMGLGDILVLLFFGIVPVGFTYYIMTGGVWTLYVTLAGVGMGLATDNLLIVNNYRDVEQDRESGKKTVVVRYGKSFGLKLYMSLGIISVLLGIAALIISDNAKYYGIILLFVYLWVHLTNYKKMKSFTGKDLNKVLGTTALGIFLYGATLALSFLL